MRVSVLIVNVKGEKMSLPIWWPMRVQWFCTICKFALGAMCHFTGSYGGGFANRDENVQKG